MKKYFFGLTAIALALGFSAFTSKKVIGNSFGIQLVSTTKAKAENKVNYQLAAPVVTCGTPAEVACTIEALTKYSHPESGGIEVLNTATNNPNSEPILTITATQFGSQAKYFISSITASDAGVRGTDFDFSNADN